MSAVVITGDTSGTVTLQAPAVAGTTTLTLPATNGTIVTTASGQSLASPAVTGTMSLNGVNMSPYTMKNRVINGAMLVSQRNGTTATTITNATDFFGPDRWKYYRNVGGTFTTTQSSTAPAGFNYSMLTTASTGASPSAAQYNFFQHVIEGYNTADLGWGTANAKTMTLSFWVRSSVTGTYPISIGNNDVNRTLVSTYTISAANTWEYKTITIAGDTSGTWLTDNNSGIRIYFDLGSGSDHNTTTTDTWASSFKLRTSSCVTWGATTGATFYLTGVQFEVGSAATSFEWRHYGMELNNCFRYYYKYPGSPNIHGMLYSSGKYIGTVFFPMTMRATPTISDLTGNYGTIENVGVSGMYMVRFADNTYLSTYSASAEL